MIAAVIINYNTSAITYQAVESLIKNCEQEMIIAVVDNFSTNSDFIMLKNKLERIGFLFVSEKDKNKLNINRNKLFLLRNSKNEGYAGGNNFGIRFVLRYFEPEYILIMNSDVHVNDNNVINSLITAIEINDENVVAAMPLINNKNAIPSDPRYQIQIRKLSGYFGTVIYGSPLLKRVFRFLFNRYIFKKQMPFSEKVLKAYVLSGAFTIYKTAFLKSVDFFDENTFLYCEEIIMGFKMKEKNYIGILVPYVSVNHIQGKSILKQEKFDGFIFYNRSKSSSYYLKKYLNVGAIKISFFWLIRKVEAFFLSLFLNGNLGEYKKFRKLCSRK